MGEKHKNLESKPKAMRSKLAQQVDKGTRTVADYLGQQSDRLSPKGRKFTFLFLGIVMAGVCISLIVKPFQQSGHKSFVLPSQASVPVISAPTQEPDSIFSEHDYQMLVSFKTTLDSLKQSDPTAYEGLMKNRKGLMDSVNFLIEIYR